MSGVYVKATQKSLGTQEMVLGATVTQGFESGTNWDNSSGGTKSYM